MRAVLALTAAFARASGETLGDEVVLLQQKAADAPSAKPFELICDELKGCRYEFSASEETVPYLTCDEKRGCHYVGAEAPRKAPPGLFELDPQEMTKRFEEQQAEALGNAARSMSESARDVSKQLQAWRNEYRGAEWGRLLPPSVKSVEQLLAMTDMHVGRLFHALRTGEPASVLWNSNDTLASVLIYKKAACMEGPSRSIQEMIEKLMKSPIAESSEKEASTSSCKSRGYQTGPLMLPCNRRVDHYIKDQQEFTKGVTPVIFSYVMKHGMEDYNNGMKELCRD